MLTNYMYVFSIYQHIQFVPVVIAVAFGFVMVHQWESHKDLMRALTAITGIYVLTSGAFLAIGFFAGFVLLFFGGQVFRRSGGRLRGLAYLVAGIAAAVLMSSWYYSNVKGNTDRFGNASAYVQKFNDLAQGRLPNNIAQRAQDWRQFSGWIVSGQPSRLESQLGT